MSLASEYKWLWCVFVGVIRWLHVLTGSLCRLSWDCKQGLRMDALPLYDSKIITNTRRHTKLFIIWFAVVEFILNWRNWVWFLAAMWDIVLRELPESNNMRRLYMVCVRTICENQNEFQGRYWNSQWNFEEPSGLGKKYRLCETVQ